MLLALVGVGIALHECLTKLRLERVFVHALRDLRVSVGLILGRFERLASRYVRLALVEACSIALTSHHVGGAVLGISHIVTAWRRPTGHITVLRSLRQTSGHNAERKHTSKHEMRPSVFAKNHMNLQMGSLTAPLT